MTLFAVTAAYFVRRTGRYDALFVLFATLVVVANIIAVKTIEFDFGIAKFYAPAGVIVFAVTFLITDIVNEKFGRGRT